MPLRISNEYDHITHDWKRRVRIEGAFDALTGYHMRIYDAETGREIGNISKAVITLIPNEYNAVELSYYPTDEDGRVLPPGDSETVRVNFPDLGVTAWEIETTSHDPNAATDTSL